MKQLGNQLFLSIIKVNKTICTLCTPPDYLLPPLPEPDDPPLRLSELELLPEGLSDTFEELFPGREEFLFSLTVFAGRALVPAGRLWTVPEGRLTVLPDGLDVALLPDGRVLAPEPVEGVWDGRDAELPEGLEEELPDGRVLLLFEPEDPEGREVAEPEGRLLLLPLGRLL